jgi:site-specific recombinase XerD
MKLVNRERVDGTDITIGQRTYVSNGKEKVCKTYSAEYRDSNGKQFIEPLDTTNKLMARRVAIELQQRLEKGIEQTKPSTIIVEEIIKQYTEIVRAKGAAPKTVAKYKADLEKLQDFCTSKKIMLARQFSENDLYLYRQFLVDKKYADKTVQGAIILAKQMFKWAWRQGILQHYRLEAASFPKAKAAPQPCFTTEQVDTLITKAVGNEKLSFALMGYAGLRIGEVEQLCKQDIIIKNKQFTMIHVCRGGSNGTTKDREDRFVPVHPKIAELLAHKKISEGVLLPDIRARELLKRLKTLCAVCKFTNPNQYKLHSFRHHFASMCANHGVAYRKALAWLGHSNSEMLDLYYHLHDDDSQKTMMELAKSGASDPDDNEADDDFEDSLRTVAGSKIVKNPQVPELQELMDVILAENKKTERAGFEPAVLLRVHWFSKPARSAAPTPLRFPGRHGPEGVIYPVCVSVARGLGKFYAKSTSDREGSPGDFELYLTFHSSIPPETSGLSRTSRRRAAVSTGEKETVFQASFCTPAKTRPAGAASSSYAIS